MAKAASTLAWTEINPASLPADVLETYEAYKEAYRQMKKLREGFEQHMNEAVNPPAGKRVVCGYNFGKLSIALADDERKPAKAQGSLADFLASAQSSGRRC